MCENAEPNLAAFFVTFPAAQIVKIIRDLNLTEQQAEEAIDVIRRIAIVTEFSNDIDHMFRDDIPPELSAFDEFIQGLDFGDTV